MTTNLTTKSNRELDLTYYATYTETDATTEEWHDWLVNCEAREDGPSELSTIVDVCASAKIKASLRDEAGHVRGWVNPDGNYGLT